MTVLWQRGRSVGGAGLSHSFLNRSLYLLKLVLHPLGNPNPSPRGSKVAGDLCEDTLQFTKTPCLPQQIMNVCKPSLPARQNLINRCTFLGEAELIHQLCICKGVHICRCPTADCVHILSCFLVISTLLTARATSGQPRCRFKRFPWRQFSSFSGFC